MWQGSAFNCTSHEISLFHVGYESTEGAYGECDGIVGQSVRSNVNTTNGNNSSTVTPYVSQLTVPINSGTIGKTIECFMMMVQFLH